MIEMTRKITPKCNRDPYIRYRPLPERVSKNELTDDPVLKEVIFIKIYITNERMSLSISHRMKGMRKLYKEKLAL